MQEETLRRDELAELLGGSDANLRFRMPDVERETPDPILDDNARRLQRGHARTGAPQLLHGRLGALEIRFGHHSQATSLHVGAVDADVGKAMQPQPALERLHLARGEHRAARVGRRAEPDQRRARGWTRPQVPVRGSLRQRRIEGEEPVERVGFGYPLTQIVRFRPE